MALPVQNSDQVLVDEEDDQIVVETDPTGRFERYNVSLGTGAYKQVYKAFDQEEGIEVAWNQLRVDHFQQKDISQIASEIEILREISNDNIINLQHSWISTKNGKKQICFITELMTSGTLKSYISKTKGPIKPKVVKNWAKQILMGLHYLHTRDPPIIHRDLKCQNIFINGNNGQAKIGDLGLATVKRREHLSSVLGTPEFMAPELYDEHYDEKVDIYAFGMVILEIATKEYPYNECQNQAQIFKKVSSGIKPQALSKVVDQDIRQLIETCIAYNPQQRPSATELLQHPFFSTNAVQQQEQDSSESLTASPHHTPLSRVQSTNNLATVSDASSAATTVDSSHHTFLISPHQVVKQDKSTATCEVESALLNDQDQVHLRMMYNNGTVCQEIKFPFDLNEDTATDVVAELVEAKLIEAIDEQLVRRRIEEAVRFILIRQRSTDVPSEKSDRKPLFEKETESPHSSFGSDGSPVPELSLEGVSRKRENSFGDLQPHLPLRKPSDSPNAGMVGSEGSESQFSPTSVHLPALLPADRIQAIKVPEPVEVYRPSDMQTSPDQFSPSFSSLTRQKSISERPAPNPFHMPRQQTSNTKDVEARLKELEEVNLRGLDTLVSSTEEAPKLLPRQSNGP